MKLSLTSRRLFPLLILAALTACEDGLPSWLGADDEEKAPLPGKRISVLDAGSNTVPVDESLASVDVTLPSATATIDWPQEGENAANYPVHPAWSGAMNHTQEAQVGNGADWENALPPTPIVAAGMVFAMDATGVVSAHDSSNIDQVIWTSEAAVGKDEPDILSGGLAYDNGNVIVSTRLGEVVSFNAVTGAVAWKQNIGIPLRSAPRVAFSKVFVATVDNQLFALNQGSGEVMWNHRGINENAGFMTTVTPAASDNVVIAPYSSGELFALNADSGEELWSDSLVVAKRTQASSVFSGIDGNPTIADGKVFASSTGGLFAATELSLGKHLWEQEISSLNAPWVAGDFVFILSSDNQLYCMTVRDGRVKWVQSLDSYEDMEDKKNPIIWSGPVLAGNQLLITGNKGTLLLISPATGDITATQDIPEGITSPPAVASDTLYFMDHASTLYAIR